MNNNGGRGKVHILRKIFIITFLLSIFVFSQHHIEQWPATPLPIRTKIAHLQSINHNDCIAAAGKYLIQFKNGTWKIFSKQPPVKNIDRLFVSSDNNIWVSEGTYSYESNLYIFRDNKWEKIHSPFLNQIKSADFLTNGQAYFSGDRELYLLNKGQWHNFKYPPISVAIMTIKSNGKSLLALTSSRNIYLYKSSKWSLELKDKIILQIKRRGKDYFAITNSEIFKFDGTHGWQMMLNTGKKFELKKAVVLSNDNVYAISANNKLFHYAKNTWQNIELKNSDELDDIVTINDSIVIVAGNNGLTWYNGNIKSLNSDQYLSGFTSVLPVALSKEVNDEYGVCINDVNNDGLMDIYSVRIFEPNRLYVNKDKSTQRYPDFSDEAVERDVTGINGNNKQNIIDLFLGCGIADLDNDGDKDIYLCNLMGENKLFINKGNGYFRSVSNEDDRGLGKNDRSNSVIFGDIDNDGDLDIFITNEYSSNRLFINNGFGYFSDATENSGLKSDWGGMSAAFADIDNDNDPD